MHHSQRKYEEIDEFALRKRKLLFRLRWLKKHSSNSSEETSLALGSSVPSSPKDPSYREVRSQFSSPSSTK